MTLLARLVEASQRVAATPSRLEKIRELAACLAALSPQEITAAVHYLSGELSQGRIGIGYSMLGNAASAGAAEAQVLAPTLAITEVDQALGAIDALSGSGSTGRRTERLRTLFWRTTPAEQEFLVRLLAGELRQGALTGVMADAVAAAAHLPIEPVRRAAMYAPNLAAVAFAALTGGAEALDRFQLALFSPVAPMLAQSAVDVGEALHELGEAAFEYKLDGARIQAHKAGEEVRLYTRTLNEVTAALPEIVESVRGLGSRVIVLDGEAIALDAAGHPHPFQITMRRFGRKLDVEAVRAGLPIRAFFFDCLRLEDSSIADRSLEERHEALAAAVPPELRVPRLVTSSEPQACAFYEAALAAGHEGVIAKSLTAPYEAGNRGASWLKVKRVHTLDLLVLAAEWGHGRRTGKLSNLHLGARDPATGEYVMLGKTFKGLTDALLEWQTQELLARETHRDRWTVYVRPELVVEIAFSDLQASRRYPGGLALRLARVKRYRADKPSEEADTMQTVRKLYAAQRPVGGA
ncbi:MAG: ATP-dependent DNA ligase [Steroidobacteraceae bacterium]